MNSGYNINITTLPNRLRVVTDRMDGAASAIVLVGVKAGSRNETRVNNGISHFLEHMAFKGTDSYSAKEIAERVESVGGHFNAYTSKDATVYYIRVLKEDVDLAMSTLADILQNSVFDSVELNKERGVILQELASHLDAPEYVAVDMFYSAAYGETPLGRTILGPEENIKQFTRDHIKSYMEQHYFATNMIIGVCADIAHEEIVDLTAKYFGNLKPEGESKYEPALYMGGEVVKSKDNLEQVQFLLGFKSFHQMEQKKYYQMQIVDKILGGGASSRLFQEVREKRGLVYSVSSFTDSYDDVGMFGISAETTLDKIPELIETIKMVLQDSVKQIEEREMHKIIKQFRAGMLMSRESVRSRGEKLIGNFLTYDRYVYPEEILSHIESFTTSEASELLSAIINDQQNKPTCVLYGTFSKPMTMIDSFLNLT